MNWTAAIELNRDALIRLVAMMFAATGLVRGGSVASLPRLVRSEVLRVLRAAESALRRLAVIMARELVVVLRPSQPFPAAISRSDSAPKRVPAFPLFDRYKRFNVNPGRTAARTGPNIWVIGVSEPVFPAPQPLPMPTDPMDAGQLFRRLLALQTALENLPRQARRFARWQARLRADHAKRPRRIWPFRPGWPPGYRQREVHEVDEVLIECHRLAMRVLESPDTS